MKLTAFVTPLLLSLSLPLSLCATSAMAAETVSGYAATTASSWFGNSAEHGASHHNANNLSGFGEAVSIAKSIASDVTPWQTSSPFQNSVLISSPVSGAMAALPVSLSASLMPSAAAATMTPSADNGQNTPRRAASDKLADFEAISQPGIITMILIGIGLLSLRSRRTLPQDEKFAA